jgi:hypothetical protein
VHGLVSSAPRNTPSAAPGTDVRASSQGPFSFFIPDARGADIYLNSKSFLMLFGPDSDDVARLELAYVEGNTAL